MTTLLILYAAGNYALFWWNLRELDVNHYGARTIIEISAWMLILGTLIFIAALCHNIWDDLRQGRPS